MHVTKSFPELITELFLFPCCKPVYMSRHWNDKRKWYVSITKCVFSFVHKTLAGYSFVSCSVVLMFALLRAQNRIVRSQPASQPVKQTGRQTDGQGRQRGRDRALQDEDRSGKVGHGADGVTACLSRRLLSTHTQPRDKHSRDRLLIMLHLYQDTQMCSLSVCFSDAPGRTANIGKHQVVQ